MSGRLLVLLALLLACQQPHEPSGAVGGTWAFAGTVSYGSIGCADTMTMNLSQRGDRVTGETHDWHYACNGVSATGDRLVADGVYVHDSIGLRWLTDSAHPNCPACRVFVMIGRADTIMTGWYQDMLGGAGAWSARRLP